MIETSVKVMSTFHIHWIWRAYWKGIQNSACAVFSYAISITGKRDSFLVLEVICSWLSSFLSAENFEILYFDVFENFFW